MNARVVNADTQLAMVPLADEVLVPAGTPAAPQASPNLLFVWEVSSLKGTPPSLCSEVDTFYLPTKAMREIVAEVGESHQRQTYQLLGGAADPDDDGQGEPHDYDADRNDRHWERVGS